MLKRPLASVTVFLAVLLFFLELLFPDRWGGSPPGVPEFLKEKEQLEVLGTVVELSVQEKSGKKETAVRLEDVCLPPNQSQGRELQKITASRQSIICYLSSEEQLKIGNRVVIRGTLKFFEPATNPGEFDRQDYYRNRGILFAVKKGKVLRKDAEYDSAAEKLNQVKRNCCCTFEKYLNREDASVMSALLLGEKGSMDRTVRRLYQKSGIAHILSISGLHVSLLGMACFIILRFLGVPMAVNVGCCTFFLYLYGKMIGAGASAVRAIIMFAVLLLGKLCKRSYDLVTSLSLAALLLLLGNPLLLGDCGFLLSFTAIFGIGLVYPSWKKVLPFKNRIVEAVLSSFAVIMTTAPVLIWFFHEISFLAVLLNLLVLPFLTFLLGSGLLMLLTEGLFSLSAGAADGFFLMIQKTLAFVIRLILSWYHLVCVQAQKLPFGRWNVATPSFWKIGIYYFLLFLSTILVKRKHAKWYLLVTLLSLNFLFLPPRHEFSVWNLDVGQGDCNVIFTENGNTYLIDGGSSSKFQVGEQIIIPFLKSRGCNRIDGIFVSHLDGDHTNGIKELLLLGEQENLPVKKLFLYEGELEQGIRTLFEGYSGRNEKGEALHFQRQTENGSRRIQIGNTEITGIMAGNCVVEPDVKFSCLYPFPDQTGLSGNEASLVLRLDCGEFSGLFTGDLEKEGEKILEDRLKGEKNGLLRCRFLKVAHHGSKTSSRTAFLRKVQPQCMVVSCGRDNPHGHPHKEALDRLEGTGAALYRTDLNGAVETVLSEGKLQVKSCFHYR